MNLNRMSNISFSRLSVCLSVRVCVCAYHLHIKISFDIIFQVADSIKTTAAMRLACFFCPTLIKHTHRQPTMKYTRNEAMTDHNTMWPQISKQDNYYNIGNFNNIMFLTYIIVQISDVILKLIYLGSVRYN